LIEKLSKPGDPRIGFFHHPVLPAIPVIPPERKKYDILIWGMVAPYKGIDQFLRFVREAQLQHLKILIAGRISDNAYRNEMMGYQNEQIEIRDAFISTEQLTSYIAQSRMVLFTYLKHSILSSGALMDTLRYKPVIIGPCLGAFKDLSEEGLIYTYSDYPHLKQLLQDLQYMTPDTEKMEKFISDNSWPNFGFTIYKFIDLQ